MSTPSDQSRLEPDCLKDSARIHPGGTLALPCWSLGFFIVGLVVVCSFGESRVAGLVLGVAALAGSLMLLTLHMYRVLFRHELWRESRGHRIE